MTGVTLKISGLDNFEIEHIMSIFRDYRNELLESQLEALAKDDKGGRKWLQEHLEWHDSIIKKIEVEKLDGDLHT